MRKFGVEIEHKQPKFLCGSECTMKSYPHTGCQAKKTGEELVKVYPTWTNVHADGSGVEVTSPILCGDEGLKELEGVMEKLREWGGRVYQSDGLHVHYDAPEYLVEDEALAQKRIVTLAQSWCNNQAIINELVPNHRRADWFKCELAGHHPTSCYKQITQEYVELVKKVMAEGFDDRAPATKCGRINRFYALNVSALSTHGTVEIRQYQGTLNFDRARAWINFGQGFIEAALQDDDVPIAPYSTIDSLMRDIGLDSYDRGILSEVGT